MAKYCSNCGKELPENAYVCLNCGVKVNGTNINSNNVVSKEDKGGFGWGALGFFVPIAGLVLYLVWKDERPKCAKSVGIGALVSVIVGVLIYILAFILIFTIDEYDDNYYDDYYNDYYYNFE